MFRSFKSLTGCSNVLSAESFAKTLGDAMYSGPDTKPFGGVSSGGEIIPRCDFCTALFIAQPQSVNMSTATTNVESSSAFTHHKNGQTHVQNCLVST